MTKSITKTKNEGKNRLKKKKMNSTYDRCPPIRKLPIKELSKFYTQETHSIKCKSVQALRVGEAKVILKDEYNLEIVPVHQK